MSSAARIKPMGAFAQALTAFRSGFSFDAKPAIQGVDAASWWSPGQPVRPVAPEGTPPARMPFWGGQNMIYTPRPDAAYTSEDLKNLASYDLVRVIIENIKDQICRTPLTFQLRMKPGETKREHKDRTSQDSNLVKLQDFFRYPDGERDFSSWVRPLLEDMLVIDAPAILIRKLRKSGEVGALDVLSGESITRYIDANGYTPRPPSPAYAQVWWGMPRVNLTTEELVYRPRNIVPRNTISSYLYGMSPVEQAATWISIGTNRLKFQGAYYESGSVPGVMQVVPAGVPPDQVEQALQWMNSKLAGDLAARRQVQLIQGFQEQGRDEQIIFSKEALLSDPFDDLIIRCLCFTFGTSPQRLMKMMNRASAQQADEAAEQEGLWPWLSWLQGTLNYIIQILMKKTDYECVLQPRNEVDTLKAAQADEIRLKGRNTLNELREAAGEDRREEPQADQIGTWTPQGFIPITQEVVSPSASAVGEGAGQPGKPGTGKPGTQDEDEEEEPDVPAKPGKKNGNGHGTKKASCGAHTAYDNTCVACSQREIRRLETAAAPARYVSAVSSGTVQNGGGTGGSNPVGFMPQIATSAVLELLTMCKAAVLRHDTAKPSFTYGELVPNARNARNQLQATLHAAFQRMESTLHKELSKHFSKAAADDDKVRRLTVQELIASLEEEWGALPARIRKDLNAAADAGMNNALLHIEFDSSDALDELNSVARDWANDRAAELVGMRYNSRGDLVRNSRARYAITDTTRDELRYIITEAFEEDTKFPTLVQQIEDAGTFSEDRAALIARTEVSRAQGYGNLAVWKKSGVVPQVDWINSEDPAVCPECALLEMLSPYDIDDVPEFPHPQCRCTLVAHLEEQ